MGQAIGIDFGTTTTIVTYKNRKGKWRQLRYQHDDSIIPSVLFFKTREDYLIGREAANLQAAHPEAAISEFKRHLGDPDFLYEVTPLDDPEPFRIRPRKAAMMFLQKIFADAGQALLHEFAGEGEIDEAVLTVPAKFSLPAKRAAQKAVNDGGIPDVLLANEPTAAAVAAAEDGDLADGESVLVYDFGGGTFDVSVIQRRNGAFHEVATNGIAQLGGSDLTQKLLEQLVEEAEDDFGISLPIEEEDLDESQMSHLDWQKNLRYLRDAAEKAKIELSEKKETHVTCQLLVRGQLELLNTLVSRKNFEDAIRSDIEKTIKCTRQTIDEAHDRGINTIDRIVLAGGTSTIPLISDMINAELQGQDCEPSANASTLVSKGAAMLANEANLSAEAITNVQYGVASAEGMMLNKFQTIIDVDQPLPCSGTRTFYLASDGQRSLTIDYYERDIKNYPRAARANADGVERVERLTIDNLPEGLSRADTEIIVTFTVSINDVRIDVRVQDNAGKEIQAKNLTIQKDSDLERLE